MSEKKYSIYVINGDVFSWADDPYIPALMYRGLSWDKACELVQLSFHEGYECVIWQQNGGEAGDTNDVEKSD